MDSRQPTGSPQEQLNQLFGAYKAEWLGERLFDLFTEPSYFPSLTTPRPCLLEGGRGTGKTTVLRGLSYEGQFALHNRDINSVAASPYYGIYYRVNTNRVAAFSGAELPEREWQRLFAHYFNLLLCSLTLRFLEWYQLYTGSSTELGEKSCSRVSISLNLSRSRTNRQLTEHIDSALTRFEAYINNVADGNAPNLSLQGAPIDALMESVSALPQFQQKSFFFLIDEYENFADYQQQVVNTLIKHSGQLYTFKIGVRELGWRVRTALSQNEQLISPADYARIDIAEELEGDRFKEFALSVCNERLMRVQIEDGRSIHDIRELLPGLTEDEEAEKLGIREAVQATKSELLAQGGIQSTNDLDDLDPLQLYLIGFWARSSGRGVREEYLDFLQGRSEWDTRYANYKHALLYTLRRGKRGIRKYYAGWDTLTQVAAGNIRYLLELVAQSLSLHLRDDNKLTSPVSPDAQTTAAQNVGREYLKELEGLSVHGATLTKLLLGLGRVFGIMAVEAEGHTPEVNQFHLAESSQARRERLYGHTPWPTDTDVESLLKAAVMHLALVRFPANKLADKGDIREYDYMVHPVFAPLFVFSYRHKRKMTISAAQLLGLVNSPKRTIKEVLAASERIGEDPLPEQLSLFEAYYAADS